MKLTLDPKDWSEPRFEALRRAMGWTQAEALGVLVLFWHGTREDGVVTETRERLLTYLSVPPETAEELFNVMKTVGYVERKSQDNAWTVGGNDSAVGLARQRRTWGLLGAEKAKANQPKAKPAPDPAAAEEKALKAAGKEANRRCWESYRDAYRARYRCEPLRDAKVNVMIAQFVKRIGQERAPDVIRFFVELDEPRYVHGTHALNLALRDAEAIYTQWQIGPLAQGIGNIAREAHTRGQLQRVARGDL